MGEAKLPEELLREILSLRLSIPEDDFCKFSRSDCPPWMDRHHPSRWERNERPSSDLLLVSKRWLRVGSPLLYESLAIWDPKHTKSVARLVQSNPAIGKSIRRLRVEGGCGKDLHTIVKHAPNVHTLYICLHVKASEGIAGLRKALPMMRPAKLYWMHRGLRTNKAVVEAKVLLESCILHQWTSLKSVTLSEFFHMTPGTASALAGAPALEELIIDTHFGTSKWLSNGYIRTIGENANLKEIRSMGNLGRKELGAADLPKRIIELFNFVETEWDRRMACMFAGMDEHLAENQEEAKSTDDEDEVGIAG